MRTSNLNTFKMGKDQSCFILAFVFSLSLSARLNLEFNVYCFFCCGLLYVRIGRYLCGSLQLLVMSVSQFSAINTLIIILYTYCNIRLPRSRRLSAHLSSILCMQASACRHHEAIFILICIATSLESTIPDLFRLRLHRNQSFHVPLISHKPICHCHIIRTFAIHHTYAPLLYSRLKIHVIHKSLPTQTVAILLRLLFPMVQYFASDFLCLCIFFIINFFQFLVGAYVRVDLGLSWLPGQRALTL